MTTEEAIKTAVKLIKAYCDSRTGDDGCIGCIFQEWCGVEPYTWDIQKEDQSSEGLVPEVLSEMMEKKK